MSAEVLPIVVFALAALYMMWLDRRTP